MDRNEFEWGLSDWRVSLLLAHANGLKSPLIMLFEQNKKKKINGKLY